MSGKQAEPPPLPQHPLAPELKPTGNNSEEAPPLPPRGSSHIRARSARTGVHSPPSVVVVRPPPPQRAVPAPPLPTAGDVLLRYLSAVPDHEWTPSPRQGQPSLPPVIYVSGNWYDSDKAAALARAALEEFPESSIFLSGGIGRLTLPSTRGAGGEPVVLQRRLVELGVPAERIAMWTGSKVTTHNSRGLVLYLQQLEDMATFGKSDEDIELLPRDVILFEEGFLVRRCRASLVAEISSAIRRGRLRRDGLGYLSCRSTSPAAEVYEDFARRHAEHAGAAAHLIVGEMDRIDSYSCGEDALFERAMATEPGALSADSDVWAVLEEFRTEHSASLQAYGQLSPDEQLRCRMPGSVGASTDQTTSTPDGQATSASGAEPETKTRSKRASSYTVRGAGAAFRFMEDSPMFRGRLAWYQQRAKKLFERLGAMIKTTEQYKAVGEKFANQTAALAADFGRYYADDENSQSVGKLAEILLGLSSTLREVEQGHYILIASLEHAFLNRLREFSTLETARLKDLTRIFTKTSEAHESAIAKALAVRNEADQTPTATSRDDEVMDSFGALEMARFDLIRYYNQLDARKTFELVEGVCALLYAYKAHFSQCADSIITLVPQMTTLQEEMVRDRDQYQVADKIWAGRRDDLVESLQRDQTSLAQRYKIGNSEYPIETFASFPMSLAATGPGRATNGAPPPIKHMGYLYKLSSSVRRDWKRRWFVLQGGNLYYVRNHRDTEPTLVCQVLLCTVRVCHGPKAHRFSFELISPNRRTYLLQASNRLDMERWVNAMRKLTETLLVGGGSSAIVSTQTVTASDASNVGGSVPSSMATPQAALAGTAERRAAPAMAAAGTGEATECTDDAASHERSTAVRLQDLMRANPTCADCGSANPDWAAINMGVLFCLRCSGVHRGLGVHVSKVRSVTLDAWAPSLISVMERLGNDRVNGILEQDIGVMSGWHRPEPDCAVAQLKQFIRAKYEHRGFVKPAQESADALLVRLHEASRRNDVQDVIWCIFHGADTNELTQQLPDHDEGDQLLDAYNAVHVACAAGALEALVLLVQNGGSLNTISRNGLSPLDIAMVKGHTNMVEYCLEHLPPPPRRPTPDLSAHDSSSN